MAVRIQIRRDSSSNWTTNNPLLYPGEIGVETDTLKMKMGPTVSSPAVGTAWNSITSYINIVPDGNLTIEDYVPTSDIGAENGVVGLSSNNAIIPGSSIIIEGSTANAYETTLTATDPTADRTITFPDATGTVALAENVAALSGATFTGNINVPTSITFEGATADSYETTVQATDPTADRTITIPDVSGTIVTTGDTASVTNTMLANSAITINGTSTSLGGSRTLGTDDVSEGSTNKYFTDERAQDAVATALNAGTHTNISVSYDDNAGSISLTGAVTYTDENAQDAVGNAVGNGLDYDDSTGAISVDPSEFALNSVGAPTGNVAMATYKITGLGTPTEAADAATKAYVDNTTAGLNFHAPAHAATTANLTATYDNGTSGVGATLTGSGTFPQIDGHTVAEQERVLVKNQSTGSQNGLYVLTDDGDPSGSWVLTRATDADNSPAGEVAYGDFCFVQNGGQAGFGFIVNTTGTITIGTTSISYVQFNAGQVVVAGNGLQEATAGTLSIDTSITADLSTAQTFTNKTLTSPKINEDVALTATATELNYVDGVTSAIQTQLNAKAPSADPTFTGTLVLPSTVNGPSISTSVNLLFPTQGGHITLGGSQTTGNLTLGGGANRTTGVIGIGTGATSSGTKTINVGTGSTGGTTAITIGSADGATSNITLNGNITLPSTTSIGDVDSTELSYVNGVTSSIQTQLDGKVDESLFDTKGDILVASADNTPAKLAVGTNGYLLTANSSATNGVEWAAAPISLPDQSGNNGKYLTTDGSSASWATLVVPIETGTDTVTGNTAETVDTTALSAFTSIEYMVSLKQGSKVRTSKVIVQTDGTSVDMTEFAITETGGTIAGVVVSAAVSSTNAVLQVTATDASSTNVTVKFSKVKL